MDIIALSAKDGLYHSTARDGYNFMNSCSAEIFVHIFTAHCPYHTLAKLRKPWVVVLDLPWMISSLNLSLLFDFLSCWFLDSKISFQLSAMVRLRWAWRLFSCQGSGIRPAFHSSSLSFFPLIFILRSLSTKTTNRGTDTDFFISILRLWFPKDSQIGVDQTLRVVKDHYRQVASVHLLNRGVHHQQPL